LRASGATSWSIGSKLPVLKLCSRSWRQASARSVGAVAAPDAPVIGALDMFVHLLCCVEASVRATSRRRQDRLLEIGATTPIVSELAHGLALRAQGDVLVVGLRCPVSRGVVRDYRRDYAPCAAGLVVRDRG
jgi:hypothetical protein